jgi:hypothetical protein
MLLSKASINLLGAVVAIANNLILCGIFLARIYKYPRIEYWLGIFFISSIIPLIIMFANAFEAKREMLYFIQLILMISFIILELLLDYVFKIDFRHNQNILIPYVTLFYASFGGMIGIVSHSGKQWTIITVVTFLVMTTLSLFMHFKTNS